MNPILTVFFFFLMEFTVINGTCSGVYMRPNNDSVYGWFKPKVKLKVIIG